MSKIPSVTIFHIADLDPRTKMRRSQNGLQKAFDGAIMFCFVLTWRQAESASSLH